MVSAQTGTDSPYKRGQVGEQVNNKINNLPGYTNYLCNPICIRVKDEMEGGDRVPERNLFSQSTTSSDTLNQTINQRTPPAPAGTQ